MCLCGSVKLFICCRLILSSFCTVVCVSHLHSLFFLVLFLVCSTLLAVCKTWWQNIRKERTKRENVKCILCFCHYGRRLVFFFSPISTARENNAVFLILSVCVFHNKTVRRCNFKENGNQFLWYTSLIKAVLKDGPGVSFCFILFCAKCQYTVALSNFKACFSSFGTTRRYLKNQMAHRILCIVLEEM